MKSFLVFSVLIFFIYANGKAQDTTLVLSADMFDYNNQEIVISEMDGWIFKAGNDTSWSKKDIDLFGWKKANPTEITSQLTDSTGKAEGWLRVKIKLDSTFKNTSLGYKIGTWAATDFYIDGKLMASFGNTGEKGTAFQEYNPYKRLAMPMLLKAGNEYTLALHVVDYISPLPPRRLKSEDYGFRFLLKLTGPDYNARFLENLDKISFYKGIWIAVTVVLTLLFWLLYLLNPQERNIRLIAIGSTLLLLHHILIYSDLPGDASYFKFILFNYINTIVLAALVAWLPFVLARIFNRNISRFIYILTIICSAGIIINTFLQQNILFISFTCTIFLVCFYYIISSLKSMKGAQWAIVTGFLLTFLFGIVYAFQDTVQNLSFTLLLITGYSLSGPLGMLVYMPIRLKEVINEVKIHTEKVVSLSEEKKQQALYQQKMLQEEVNRQTADLRTTLDHLKATQNQLIQSEKMASLGELTAGIAHEIQNPLNFVNNFSEVSQELLEELKQEIISNHKEDALAITDDLTQNLEKIHQHGKRADSIVKNMLQHSRSSSGEKQLTDINALTDEYLRLSFHGLRAKDKDFNVAFKLDADVAIPKIKVVPQEVGRVLLNLFNNSFYAVSQKKAQLNGQYQPQVTVTTKVIEEKVAIRVKDNGIGIPEAIQQKIFQPFFTTKPTGVGTGLGLSLSYDIITKGHGGELKVESREGQYSEFVVYLPLDK